QHLLCSLLYCLCAVRGFKRIVQFFPHEASDLLPCVGLLEGMLLSVDGSGDEKNAPTTPWATKYVLFLWLAMILYSPFDLRTIFAEEERSPVEKVLELAKLGLRDPSRLREAAAFLLGKLFARKDCDLWPKFAKDCQSELLCSPPTTFSSTSSSPTKTNDNILS
ncbi:unnamed protein product, partial [Amoebophrya sp. A25]